MLTAKASLQPPSNEVAALTRHDFSKNEEVMMMRRWWWTHVVAGHVIGLGMLHVGVRQHRLPLRTAAEAEPVARPSGRCRYRLRLASY